MGDKVRELVFTEKYCLEIAERDGAEPAGGEILVKNDFSLISPGTELALYTGTHVGFGDPSIPWARYPIKPGYASVGRVLAAGKDLRGIGSAAENGGRLLHFSPHADHAVVNAAEDLFFLLPPSLDEKKALFARFAQIAYTAARAARLEHEKVLILGAGMIGNLAAQIFRLLGTEVVVIGDIDEKRLEIARLCGIRDTVRTDGSDVLESLRGVTNGGGADLIVEATGVPGLVPKALEWVNEFGEVLLLGSTRGIVELNVYKLIHRKKTVLSGAHEGYFPLKGAERSRESMVKEILVWLDEGRLVVEPFITHILPPERAKEGYEGLLKNKDRYLGVFIDWR